MAISMRVKEVYYDWFYSHECGEDFKYICIDDSGVKEITHRKAQGEGDRHYCEVFFHDGTNSIIYNLNRVVFEPYSPV